MAFMDKEQFRLLFLDKRNALIADEVQQSGTVDHTPVYPREIVNGRSNFRLRVDSGPQSSKRRPDPSSVDIKITRDIIESRARSASPCMTTSSWAGRDMRA